MYQSSMKRQDLLGLAEPELVNIAVSMGLPPYRGRQLYHRLYCRKELDLNQMNELPRTFRSRLAESFEVRCLGLRQRQQSSDGTVKLLFELHDGKHIEAVYIPEESRDTLCISSQVGCGVGCTFCMTAQMGFQRNLSAGEIVGQVLTGIREGYLKERGFNVVFMGMGEPLYNYKNLIKAIRLMTDPKGMGLSCRRITVSTSGVVPVLRRMYEEPVIPNLAISLNAVADPLRDEIMPLNRKWNLEELLSVCRNFPLEPRRRITFEYILLSKVNDSDEEAHQLARLLRGMRAKVNLIPYNPNPGLPYRRPTPERVKRFQQILIDQSVSAFVRKTRGDDVAAACGQLAHLEAH